MISACVSGSSITARTLLLSPNFNLAKISPLVKEPPTQAIAAIPMASPSSPSIAVNAIELSGEVQIILMMPPSRKPITMGDCSVAAEMVSPMRVRMMLTAGLTATTIRCDSGAMISAPRMIFSPSGSFFSTIGAIRPIRYPAMNPGRIPYPPAATPATTANTGLAPIQIGTIIAAATPPRLPEVSPTVRKKSIPIRSPVMYLWTASTRKVAIAALAIPDMASCPLGIFRLNREKPASVISNNPTPDKIVNIDIPLFFTCYIDKINIKRWFQKVSGSIKMVKKNNSIN